MHTCLHLGTRPYAHTCVSSYACMKVYSPHRWVPSPHGIRKETRNGLARIELNLFNSSSIHVKQKFLKFPEIMKCVGFFILRTKTMYHRLDNLRSTTRTLSYCIGNSDRAARASLPIVKRVLTTVQGYQPSTVCHWNSIICCQDRFYRSRLYLPAQHGDPRHIYVRNKLEQAFIDAFLDRSYRKPYVFCGRASPL